MQVDAAALRDLFAGYNVAFNKGFQQTKTYWQDVAMKVGSTGAEENYSWLGDFPSIREWLGDRIIQRLGMHRYTVTNRKFEMTLTVPRDRIADDQYGIYAPMAQNIGKETAQHPDSLVFSLMADGFTEKCYDGQYFFDPDHLGYDEDGNETSVSNMQAGSGPTWFLIDAGQPLKAMIYQEREGFKFESITDSTDSHVFFRDEYVYGVRGRANAGFGFWQLAYASKATLNDANYEAARAAMMMLKKRSGKPIGIQPTHLVYGPALDGVARKLLKALKDEGGTNEWAGTVQPICSPFL
jgi:phage major head subunit gpT-like protein